MSTLDVARAQVRRVVEEHPTTMSGDAEQKMSVLLEEAASELAAEPDRADEAQQNIRRLLDRAAEMSSSGGGGGGGGYTPTYDTTEVDVGALEFALRDLCPIWPICKSKPKADNDG